MVSLKDFLDKAAETGLQITIEGDRMHVRGPKTAEPLARQILERKAEILAWWEQDPGASPRAASQQCEPPALPWRRELAFWSVARRQQWGERANALEDQGLPWQEAEKQAFSELIAADSHLSLTGKI